MIHHDLEVCRLPRQEARVDANPSLEGVERVVMESMSPGAQKKQWLRELSKEE